jgi:hypothetical protein
LGTVARDWKAIPGGSIIRLSHLMLDNCTFTVKWELAWRSLELT